MYFLGFRPSPVDVWWFWDKMSGQFCRPSLGLYWFYTTYMHVQKMKIERCRLTHLKCWFNVAYKLRWCSKKYHGKPFVLWQLCLVNDGLFLAKLASWFATIIAMNQHFYVEWRFPKMGVPPNGWFIMENQSINGWLGGTPILGNPHIWVIVSQNSTPMGSTTIPLRRLNPIWFMYDGHCISYLMDKHG